MSEETPKMKDVTIVNKEDTPLFYANYCEVSSSPEEIFLTFALRTEDPNEAKGLVRVVVSLPHAVRIAEAMRSSLVKLEDLFGPITQPKPNFSPDLLREYGIEGK